MRTFAAFIAFAGLSPALGAIKIFNATGCSSSAADPNNYDGTDPVSTTPDELIITADAAPRFHRGGYSVGKLSLQAGATFTLDRGGVTISLGGRTDAAPTTFSQGPGEHASSCDFECGSNWLLGETIEDAVNFDAVAATLEPAGTAPCSNDVALIPAGHNVRVMADEVVYVDELHFLDAEYTEQGCSNFDDFAAGILGSPCAGLSGFCAGPYAALVGTLCPVTCGTCGDFCTDSDSMMALWATQNPGWPSTCASVPAELAADGIYRVACGASSGAKPGCASGFPAAQLHGDHSDWHFGEASNAAMCQATGTWDNSRSTCLCGDTCANPVEADHFASTLREASKHIAEMSLEEYYTTATVQFSYTFTNPSAAQPSGNWMSAVAASTQGRITDVDDLVITEFSVGAGPSWTVGGTYTGHHGAAASGSGTFDAGANLAAQGADVLAASLYASIIQIGAGAPVPGWGAQTLEVDLGRNLPEADLQRLNNDENYNEFEDHLSQRVSGYFGLHNIERGSPTVDLVSAADRGRRNSDGEVDVRNQYKGAASSRLRVTVNYEGYALEPEAMTRMLNMVVALYRLNPTAEEEGIECWDVNFGVDQQCLADNVRSSFSSGGRAAAIAEFNRVYGIQDDDSEAIAYLDQLDMVDTAAETDASTDGGGLSMDTLIIIIVGAVAALIVIGGTVALKKTGRCQKQAAFDPTGKAFSNPIYAGAN